jgi:hypothetical protein
MAGTRRVFPLTRPFVSNTINPTGTKPGAPQPARTAGSTTSLIDSKSRASRPAKMVDAVTG